MMPVDADPFVLHEHPDHLPGESTHVGRRPSDSRACCF